MANPRIDDKTKEARGTQRQDRADPAPPEPPAEGESMPSRPAHLQREGRLFWKKHFKRLWQAGWITRNNQVSFIMVCEALDEIEDLRQSWEAEGKTQMVTVKGDTRSIVHPAWSEYKQLRKQVFDWLKEFGLTPPSERRHLGNTLKEPPKEQKKGKPDIRNFSVLPRGG